jgi:ADP-ribosyl-[dinitrogen reductase] hydrolase
MLDLYEDSLGDDLHAIKAWGAAVLITLLDEPEFRMLGVQSLGEKVINMNMIWLHLPLRNMGSPDREFLERWRAIVPGLCKMLRGGQNIVMHCREGVGRTGLAAACLLIELGLPAREAIRAVRNARPGSLQHLLHEQFCYAYQPLKTPGSNP